jgi:hypothetical protein
MISIAAPRAPSARVGPDVVRTARTTGVFYLGLALTGLLGSLVVRGQLYVADHPAGTLTNLLEHESLARLGIVLELGIVVTQALAALWFCRLFRGVDSFAAWSLAAFGLVNSVAILGSAALLATALDVAGDTSLAAPGAAAATVQLLYVLSGHLWGVAGLFFGLWLVPMGWLALESGWMPRPLGWLLLGGGVGYLLSALVAYLLPASDLASQLLTLPATVGELWMVGYLLVVGARAHGPAADAAADTAPPEGRGPT